jgi:hypothetical protein
VSADAWRVCPRCKANGDIGYKGNEFREDYEIGLGDADYGSDPARVYIDYTGECQRCGLLVEYKHEIPVSWEQPKPLETNMPTEEWEPRAWSRVPAGWFIRDPKGCAWEVLATESDGRYQRVTLRNSDWQEGTWPRKPGEEVEACPGTAAPEIQGAVEALASWFVVDVISDQVS